MTFNWKIPAVAAGGAFLLSLVAGIAGRVVFATVMLRAFIWAVVFGALAFGVDMLLRKYLPELFFGNAFGSEEEERTVDITLEEENPVAATRSADAEAGGTDADSEEADAAADEGLEAADEQEEIENQAAVSREADETGEIDDTDDRDQLPEGEFDDFTTVEAADSNAESETGRHVENVDVLGIEEDPETVARAVRTFMNKDQEG